MSNGHDRLRRALASSALVATCLSQTGCAAMSDRFGLLAVLGQVDRPVSYLTTGQAVPDDIEPADRSRLAQLILGYEKVNDDH